MTEPVKLPFMPLYIADYLRDTSHLRAAESGAYLHLIMAYWVKGSLPNDDRQLATIAKMTAPEWRKARPLIEALFYPGFTGHKRIDKELALATKKAKENSDKAAAAAAARWAKQSAEHARSMLQASPEHPPSNAPECTRHTSHVTGHKEVGGLGDAAMSVANALTDKLAEICGFKTQHEWPTGWYGAPMRVKGWLDHGWQPEIIEIAVRSAIATKRDGPPGSINYFEKAIARAHADAAAPLPIVKIVEAPEITHVQQPRRPRIGEGLDRLRARLRAEDDAASDEGARAEPDRGVVEILPPRKTGG